MATTRFFHLQLRTEDTEDARAFYTDVLGERAWDIVPLDRADQARRARPHWLGYLDVDDVDDAAEAFVQRGAKVLGTARTKATGLDDAAVLREPGGAVVALARRPVRPSNGTFRLTEAAWYQLNTIDVERAKDDYRTLFGWWFLEQLDLGEHGVFHPFAWHRGGAPVGWMTDVLGRVGWHAHWLFHLAVPDLETAMAAVRRRGGYVVGPFALSRSERLAVCDDSQSAAFALRWWPGAG
jgi:predicted enzyme related to lactoylglutathione lyase